PAVPQHFQHGHPRGPGGLPVVARPLDPAVLPHNVGRAIVGGVPMQFAPLRNKLPCLVLAAHPGKRANEPGLFDLDLVFAAASDRSHAAFDRMRRVPAPACSVWSVPCRHLPSSSACASRWATPCCPSSE